MDYLTKHLLGYDSDTFSAFGSDMTEDEAEAVAEALVKHWIEWELDGLMITSRLEDVRGTS
jgi:hypothetical protein